MSSLQMSSLWEELLPGIPRDITLAHIATKLPWEAFHVLASVSWGWQRAIENREIYGERVRTTSREELFVVEHAYSVKCLDKLQRDCKSAICLYSMRNKTFYELPPNPHLSGTSKFCQVIASDGNLYVCSHSLRSNSEGNTFDEIQVYVLDVAGQGQWKECTTMEGPDHEDNQLCVNCRFEVGEEHKILAAGRPDRFNSMWHIYRAFETGEPPEVLSSEKIPERWFKAVDSRRFTVGATKYLMCIPLLGNCHIYVQDTNTKSWRRQHSISSDDFAREIAPELGAESILQVRPWCFVPLNDELLITVYWARGSNQGYELLQSRGFGTKEIAWQRISHSFQVGPGDFTLDQTMCPILL